MSAPTPQTGTLDGKLSVRLAYRWFPREDARGTVVIVHGLAEHAGRYTHVVADLHARGYHVFAADLRGHGASEGPRVFINRFSEYVEDLDRWIDFAAEAAPNLPVFLLGHSMGGLIAAAHLLDRPGRVAGAILSSPGFAAEVPIPPWKDALGRAASRVLPKLAIPTGIEPAWVSRDPRVVAEYEQDQLVTDKATARWYTEFVATQEHVFDEAHAIDTPTLLLLAGDDKIVDTAVSERFFERLGAEDKAMIPYPGLYHELLNEPERDAVFADVGAWLEARTGQAT